MRQVNQNGDSIRIVKDYWVCYEKIPQENLNISLWLC